MHRQRLALKTFAKRLMRHSALYESDVESILNLNGQVRDIKNYTELAKIDRTSLNVILIVDGLIASYSQIRNGSRQITGLYIPGEMASLHTMLSPGYTQGLATMTDSIILCIPHSEIKELLANHPRLWEAFWRDITANNLILSEWIVNVGRRSAQSRLAHFFCEMAIRYENAELGNRGEFSLPINQINLADALGLTSVHVNRTLRDLRENSIANLHKGVVFIKDWQRLVQIAEFDSRYLNANVRDHAIQSDISSYR